MAGFDNPFWNLTQTLAWITHRDRAEVDEYDPEPDFGGSTKAFFQSIYGPPPPAVGNGYVELPDALRSGKLKAWGLRNGKGDVEEVQAVVWPSLTFRARPPRAAPREFHEGASMWSQLIFQRDDVLRLWPEDGAQARLPWIFSADSRTLSRGEDLYRVTKNQVPVVEALVNAQSRDGGWLTKQQINAVAGRTNPEAPIAGLFQLEEGKRLFAEIETDGMGRFRLRP